MSDLRRTRTTSSPKSAVDLTLSWNLSDSLPDIDHCVITIKIHTRKPEDQFTITNFSTNKADWYLFSSNEVRKQATNPNLLHSAEASTEKFYRTIKCGDVSGIPVAEIIEHFPKP